MKTLALDISKTGKQPADIAQFFEKNKLKRGDKIIIVTDEQKSVMLVLLGTVVLLAIAYVFNNDKKNGDKKPLSDNIIDDFFKKYNSPEAVQAEIAHDFGVEVSFESKQKNKGISSLFGIWSDRDITIENIREKSWERNP